MTFWSSPGLFVGPPSYNCSYFIFLNVHGPFQPRMPTFQCRDGYNIPPPPTPLCDRPTVMMVLLITPMEPSCRLAGVSDLSRPKIAGIGAENDAEGPQKGPKLGVYPTPPPVPPTVHLPK